MEKKMKTARKRPRFKTVREMVHAVACNGEAHGNAYIDHCMVCLGFSWGEMPLYCKGEGCAECAKGTELRELVRKVRVKEEAK
jgi:hypothetical protein